jgi:hypothetical protein
MDELEPITNMVDEGGPVYSNEESCGGVPEGWIPNTEYDESDDIEASKKIAISLEGLPLKDLEDKDMDYSGAFESDIVEAIGLSRDRADAKEVMSPIEIEAYKNVVSARWDWYRIAEKE